MPLKPTVKWSERLDYIYLTIEVVTAKDQKLDITSDKLSFYGKDEDKEYECEIAFREPIDTEETKHINSRYTELILKKQKSNLWRGILPKGQKNWLQCDWDRFVESDDEDQLATAFDHSGYKPPEDEGMGGMGGGGGMPGMGGMGGGMGGMPGMGGMGGMPGMGGMGGMPGMGGMEGMGGGDFDFAKLMAQMKGGEGLDGLGKPDDDDEGGEDDDDDGEPEDNEATPIN